MTQEESTLLRLLRKCIPKKREIWYAHRPDWLCNHRTGFNLEIDFYIPSLHLAIEYQGHHHFSNKTRFRNDIEKVTEHDVKKLDLIRLRNKGKICKIIMLWFFKDDIQGSVEDFMNRFISKMRTQKGISANRIINVLSRRKREWLIWSRQDVECQEVARFDSEMMERISREP